MTPVQRLSKRANQHTGKVRFKVGITRVKSYNVSKALLRRVNFKKGRLRNVYRFPNVNVDTFDAFFRWLKSKDIDQNESSFSKRRELYNFATEAQSDQVSDKLMDTFRAKWKEEKSWMRPELLRLLYDDGLTESAYFEFGLKTMVWAMMADPVWFDKAGGTDKLGECFEVPELSERIIKEVMQYQKAPYAHPSVWIGCQFHVHANSAGCSAERLIMGEWRGGSVVDDRTDGNETEDDGTSPKTLPDQRTRIEW